MRRSAQEPQQAHAELLRRSQAGDAEAYAELLRLVAARVAVPRPGEAGGEAQQRRTEAVLRLTHQLLRTADPARPIGPWVDALAAAVDRRARSTSTTGWPAMAARGGRLVAGIAAAGRRALRAQRHAGRAAGGAELGTPPQGRA